MLCIAVTAWAFTGRKTFDCRVDLSGVAENFASNPVQLVRIAHSKAVASVIVERNRSAGMEANHKSVIFGHLFGEEIMDLVGPRPADTANDFVEPEKMVADHKLRRVVMKRCEHPIIKHICHQLSHPRFPHVLVAPFKLRFGRYPRLFEARLLHSGKHNGPTTARFM